MLCPTVIGSKLELTPNLENIGLGQKWTELGEYRTWAKMELRSKSLWLNLLTASY